MVSKELTVVQKVSVYSHVTQRISSDKERF